MTDSEKSLELEKETNNSVLVLPLRDTVIYPFMVIPLFINRAKSIKTLDLSVKSGKQIFFVAQRNSKKEDPTSEDLYEVGSVANVIQVLKLPDGAAKILVEGINRGKLKKIIDEEHTFSGEIEILNDEISRDNESEALTRTLINSFEEYTKLNPKIPAEILSALSNITDPGRLADIIAAHLPMVSLEDKQLILETQYTKDRLKIVIALLSHELEILQVEEKVKKRVKTQLNKSQHEFYLHEKMKAIQKELDELNNGRHSISDFEKLKLKIEKVGLSKEAKEKAVSELNKLSLMPPLSSEATVSRNYLDWLLDLPWQDYSKINSDLKKAEKILDKDHYGLEKVKERIIEYLAVQNRLKKVKGPILCLVGPPGVGKTSLGQSIARATGRKFLRISLGGIRDEAEIRGHRRTYIGSSPGKILQKMVKGKVKNPLFMLDEVDKMAMDFRGDPASALLEVLDPEQNQTFNDHYVEVDYDLSDVMFIATSNSLDIPPPLLDRMEIIRLSGYTEEEKLNIAINYLIPKQIKENGLSAKEISFSNDAILEIIRYYTREAGVRNLEREIAKICRKILKKIVSDTSKNHKKENVTKESLESFLGAQIFHIGLSEKKDLIGQVHGLAWTEAGGDLLTIEVAIVPGKGKTTYTGQLGEVMQESIHAALTVVRSRAATLGIKKDFHEKMDIHVHVPEGATPKDGPSAGIGMCTALVSALANIPVRADVAMTGEITLRGKVLQIGGLKEKLLAALRGGIKTVIIPEENVRELKELPKNITSNLNIVPVKEIDEVITIALKTRPRSCQNREKGKYPS